MTAYNTADRTHQQERINRLIKHYSRYPDRDIWPHETRRLYVAWGYGPQKSTVRRDIRTAENRGQLTGRGPQNRRFYRLNLNRLKAAA